MLIIYPKKLYNSSCPSHCVREICTPMPWLIFCISLLYEKCKIQQKGYTHGRGIVIYTDVGGVSWRHIHGDEIYLEVGRSPLLRGYSHSVCIPSFSVDPSLVCNLFSCVSFSVLGIIPLCYHTSSYTPCV